MRGGAARPDVSVIIPCYRCGATLADSVDRLTSYLDTLSCSWEIVLVDDGSDDDTGDIVEARADGIRILPLRLPENHGKGKAVAVGMLRARGACRIFTDADLPYALDAIPRCVDKVRSGSPAVFGNRLLAGSDARAQPWIRKGLGRLVQTLVGSLLGRRDMDTQCGFKGFSGPLAEVLFADLRTDGFLFDVELALLLVRAGVELDFLPVVLENQGSSTVRILPTALRSLREGWGILSAARRSDGRVEKLRSVAYLRSNT